MKAKVTYFGNYLKFDECPLSCLDLESILIKLHQVSFTQDQIWSCFDASLILLLSFLH